MNVVLTPDGPLDAGGTLARYHLWGEDPANLIAGDVFRRVLRHHGRLVPYEVRWRGPVDDARIVVHVPGTEAAALGAAATAGACPDAARLARARPRELRALKYSTRKAEYIRDLARAVVAGALDLDALAAAPAPIVIERLTALRGLGRWTADWFLARCLGRGDV